MKSDDRDTENDVKSLDDALVDLGKSVARVVAGSGRTRAAKKILDVAQHAKRGTRLVGRLIAAGVEFADDLAKSKGRR